MSFTFIPIEQLSVEWIPALADIEMNPDEFLPPLTHHIQTLCRPVGTTFFFSMFCFRDVMTSLSATHAIIDIFMKDQWYQSFLLVG